MSRCLPTRRREPWVSGQSGGSQRWRCWVLATSGATAPAQRLPLFRGARRWRARVEKAPVLHLVGGTEDLTAKRLAYLTGRPARPRLRTLQGQRGAGRRLRSCQPQNKPFSSREHRREVSRCPGQSHPSHTSSSWGSEDGPLSTSASAPTPLGFSAVAESLARVAFFRSTPSQALSTAWRM